MSAEIDRERQEAPAGSERVSVDRLRERTDELELLISGLTMFALFALPGWLFERFTEYYTLLPLWLLAAAMAALPIISTMAYTLAICLLAHLGVRAYWVGLIGLSAIFPEGIRWERARHLGPLTRERLQQQLSPLKAAIAGADRLASLLFSVITLAALMLCWIGLLGTLVFVTGAAVGSALGSTNAVISRFADSVVMVSLGSAVLVWLLDAKLAARFPGLQHLALFRALVWVLAIPIRIILPAKLIGPVRLTLQTNTHPRLFTVGLLVLVLVLPILGSVLFQSRLRFDPMGTQRFASSDDVGGGLRSGSYENQLTPQDRMRAAVMIPSALIESAWLPVFAPYVPLRDDSILLQRCAARPEATEAEADTDRAPDWRLRPADEATACLLKLWRLQLDGVEVALQSAMVSERRDLGLRGVSGWLDLRQLQPGPHELRVTWRPDPERDRNLDDYVADSTVYRIPFLWSPEFAAEPGRAAPSP
ncbi:MAG: hypothetical protein AB7E72_14730 [Lysobacterales bacterium]